MLPKNRFKAPLSLILFLLSFVLMGGNAVANESNEVGSTNAIVTDEEVYPGDSDADEGKTRGTSNFPENFEDYIPIPLPDRTEPESTEPKSEEEILRQRRVVSYNLITGKEVIHEPGVTLEDVLPTDYAKGGKGEIFDVRDEEELLSLNFSDPIPIPNPEDYPWRINAKVYVTFASGNYACSGTLIDFSHVITAGHCVYDVLHGGAWASSVVVIPGYKNGVHPYGDASAVQLHSWTGWTQYADFDHDIGIIDLDRPVGALTGWHGYGYNDSCSFYLNNTFNNVGYPGQDMYHRYGTFDGCEANKIYFDGPSSGGWDGSNVYHINSGNRTVYAVVYNSTPSRTYAVRITSGKFYNIRDSIIAEDTPSSCDIIILDVNTSPPIITAGDQLSSMDYLVCNYSSASCSGTFCVDVYLSTNDNISTADTLIQTHCFSWSFGPKSCLRVKVIPPPIIPPAIPGGDYYIGVILNISDYNTANNVSDGQDASPIHVNPISPETACFDNMDNDQDGLTDCGDPDCEGATDGACSTGNPGICAAGTLTCSGGTEVCKQDNQPEQEGPAGDPSCFDNLDNDCDGLTDKPEDPDCQVDNDAIIGFSDICCFPGGEATLTVSLDKQGHDVASVGFTVNCPPDKLYVRDVACSPALAALGFSCTAIGDCNDGTVQVLVTPPIQTIPEMPKGEIMEISFQCDPNADTGLELMCTDQPPECMPLLLSNVECGDTGGQNIPCTSEDGCVDLLPCDQGDCNGDGKVTTADVTLYDFANL